MADDRYSPPQVDTVEGGSIAITSVPYMPNRNATDPDLNERIKAHKGHNEFTAECPVCSYELLLQQRFDQILIEAQNRGEHDEDGRLVIMSPDVTPSEDFITEHFCGKCGQFHNRHGKPEAMYVVRWSSDCKDCIRAAEPTLDGGKWNPACEYCRREWQPLAERYGVDLDALTVDGIPDVPDRPFAPSHTGYAFCRSGSIASGGTHAHCTCDSCF